MKKSKEVDLDLELEEEEEEEVAVRKTVSEKEVSDESSIPEGYLSIEELVIQHPDFSDTMERAFGMKEGMPTKPTMKVMVYINEPIPIKARILSKDTIEMLPNKQPISMLAYDVLQLIGEPKYRFDLTEAPTMLNILNDNWGAMKRQALEYSFRVSQHAGRGEKMARYVDAKYTKLLEQHELLDKIPDIRILVNANVVESVAPKVDLLEKIWDVMKLNNIRPDRDGKYSTTQKKLVATALEQDAHIYGMVNLLKGKNSDAHVAYFMKQAYEQNVPIPV